MFASAVSPERGAVKEESKAYGKITQVFPDSLVIVEFGNPLKGGLAVGEFELDELQFYTGTNLVQEIFAQTRSLQEIYTLNLGPYSSSEYRSKFKCYRVLKLFQDFPHGRIYINRQIQISIIRKLKEESERVLEKQQEAVFLRAFETGDLWLRIYMPFQTRILNFVQDQVLPEPETRETLMQRSELELQKEIFVAPFSENDKTTLQRIQIHKLIYGKQLVNVTFIDFGVQDEIKLDKIYSAKAIDANYAYFPPLAVKCHLHNIVSLDIDAFAKIVQNKQLCIELTKTFQNTTDVDVVPDIDVYVQYPDQRSVCLEDLVISQGVGIPEVHNPRCSGLDWLNSITRNTRLM